MPMVSLQVFATGAACAEAAGEEIVRAMPTRSPFVLGVATGATPVPTYANLVHRRPDIDGVHVVLLDEYVGLEPGDCASYRQTICNDLTYPLGIPDERVHSPAVHRSDLHSACAEFERTLVRLGGVDLQVLGIGRNGHIGFNEPGSLSDSRTRVVRLASSTRAANGRYFPDVEAPTTAVTQGIATILAARRLLLLATGAGKASALATALLGPPTTAIPASMIRDHPDALVLADAQAASLLPESLRRPGPRRELLDTLARSDHGPPVRTGGP